MGINTRVLVADNGYMDDNVIKYAYEIEQLKINRIILKHIIITKK